MRSTAKCDIMLASSGGFFSMKTKIIYISGNEAFDMADIRAAFEEVRNTLGLDEDTVMFGVPVDNDDSLNALNNINEKSIQKAAEPKQVIENDIEPKICTNETIEVPSHKELKTPDLAEKNIKKSTPRKTRVREKVESEVTDSITEQSESVKEDKKIIPILSILAAKKETYDDAEKSGVKEVQEETEENIVSISDIDITTETETSNVSEDEKMGHEFIADMITDDAPEAPTEKTLEQLLESMTPLQEDVTEDFTKEAEITDENQYTESSSDSITADDADATLEQLAAEFAENQDKIPVQPKNETHSKIGKLKNILPFKKAKKDETGLMGDLFGWAGIAANDDDFAIPGFFTNAASKK